MSSLVIKKAERKQAKIKLSLSGPSGSGKTMSALRVGYGLVADWEKICVIDTEHNSADLYAHLGPFSTLHLAPPYEPERFEEAIKLAEASGFSVIIIDSLSHEWEGPGGILEIVDKMGGKMWNWKDVTPRHQRLVNTILHSTAHIIVTLRTKADYAVSKDDKNKTVVEKVGLKPVTREGFDYELTIGFDLDIHNHAKASKDRTSLFMGQPPRILDENAGKMILAWCESGVPLPQTPSPAAIKAQNVKRMESLPQSVKDAIKWLAEREHWKDGERAKKILDIMDANQDDPESILSFLTEKGWKVPQPETPAAAAPQQGQQMTLVS